MKLGFTGTRDDMTCAQHKTLCDWVKARSTLIEEFHSGWCDGADDEAFMIIKEFAPDAETHAHPSNIRSMQAASLLEFADAQYDPKPPLVRNHDIVDAIDEIVATPKQDHEILRSGTWATIRYARKKRKKVTIIWPDGTVELPPPLHERTATMTSPDPLRHAALEAAKALEPAPHCPKCGRKLIRSNYLLGGYSYHCEHCIRVKPPVPSTKGPPP